MSISIDQKLADLSKTSKNPFIFRVHERLRKQNEEAYEPEIISIGPYHHGKENLKKMEKYKLKYLQGILQRRGETSAQRYIAALRDKEKEARDCYEEDICMISQDFVEMMLLDGCFIIEFLRKKKGIVQSSEDDHIFSMGWYGQSLCSDLLLFENQLPFSILELLFGMTKIENHLDQLISLSISCLEVCFHKVQAWNVINKPADNKGFHLLRLMHESWGSSFPKATNTQGQGPTAMEKFIKSVCELNQYGIKFDKAEESRSWLDIEFKNGIMQIPSVMFDDNSETILRNLIAYEQYTGYSRSIVVTDYLYFIDCLINSSTDVQMLRDKKIITNCLGSDEELANMINKICLNVSGKGEDFSYRKLFKDVNEHCSRRQHRWIADLNKKYFHNPWSIISVMAAVALLLLTLVQTIYAVL